jgi:hypothetical protein
MNNIKGIGLADVDWIGLIQGKAKWKALVHAAMNRLVP